MSSTLLRALFVSLLCLGALPAASSAAPAALAPSVDGPATGAAPAFSTQSSVNGSGQFLGQGPSSPVSYLPTVRTDLASAQSSGGIMRDTLINVSNLSNTANTVTVTFYDSNGSAVGSVPKSLGPWASASIDAAQVVNNFDGSAVVSGGTSPVAAAVNLLDPSLTEALDSYSGIPAGTTLTWMPLAPNGHSGYDTDLHLQNTTANPAHVTITLTKQGATQATYPETINGNGVFDFDLQASYGAGFPPIVFNGQVIISSDQPLAAVGDLAGSGIYGASALAMTGAGSHLALPRFNATMGATNWNTGLVLFNTDSSNAHSYTLTIYNANGSVASTANSGSIGPLHTWNCNLSFVVNSSCTLNPALPDLFVGSALVTSDDGSASATVLAANTQGQGSSFTGLSAYVAPPTAGSGTTAIVPGLLNNVSGLSTGFALINSDASPQTYNITFYNQSGGVSQTSKLTLQPQQYGYLSQAGSGSGEPSGQVGYAVLQNITCGDPPQVVADVDAGSFSPALPQLVPAVARQIARPADNSLSFKVYLPTVLNNACS